LAAAFAAVLAAGFAGEAGAVTFESDDGNWRGSWDTTLSYGAQFRVQGEDCRLIANANGGCGRSANIDDGNLNYDTGLYSNVIKGVTELELSYKDDYGIFVRGSGFYDFEADQTNRTDLGTGAEGLVKQDMRLLDAFAYARFNIGDMPAEVRVGDQVISWGESTFIQGGINLTNPFDVAKLRLPGSELKEALLPQGMASFNISLTQNFSVEAYYQYEWEPVVPDPVGSYYSVNDFAVRDGDKVMLGFGAWSDQGTDWRPLGGEFVPDFNFVPRTKGSDADDDGQYGIALRYYADSLMGGMEFGLYYIRYHSRLPAISGRTGTQAGFGNAAGTATAMQGAALALSSGLSFDAAVATASAAGAQAAAAAGGNLTAADLSPAATVAGNIYLSDPSQLAYVLGNFAAHELGITSRYFVTYPEDLDLYGFSWSGYLGNTGIAWQGEVSLKQDVPLARRGTPVCGAVAPRRPLGGAGQLSDQPDGRRRPGLLQPGRQLRRPVRGGHPGLRRTGRVPVPDHADLPFRPAAGCGHGRVRVGRRRHVRRRHAVPDQRGTERAGPATQWRGHVGVRQPGPGVPALR